LAASIAATAGSSEQERKQTHLAASLAAVERGSATAAQCVHASEHDGGHKVGKRLAASIAAAAGSSEQERKQTHLADSLAAVERGSATAEQR
jgi:hypothetical protein